MLRLCITMLLFIASALAGVVALDQYLQESFRAGHGRIQVGDGLLEVVAVLAPAREGQELPPGISGTSEFPGPFCLTDELPTSVLRWQAHPVRGVEIQQLDDALHVRLTRQDRTCPDGRCWRPVDDFVVSDGDRWLEEKGCSLFAGALVRVESPARLLPPLTHDYFLLRFDGMARIRWRSPIHGTGEPAYLGAEVPDADTHTRDGRIYRKLVDRLRDGDRTVVVAGLTLSGTDVPMLPGMARLDPQLLAPLQGAASAALPRELESEDGVVLYASEEDFRDTQGWERFHRRFPGAGGFYRFSPVSWNERGTRALVYVIGWHAVLYDPPQWELGSVHDDRMGYYEFALDGTECEPIFIPAIVEEEVQDPERRSFRPPPKGEP